MSVEFAEAMQVDTRRNGRSPWTTIPDAYHIGNIMHFWMAFSLLAWLGDICFVEF